MSNNRVSFWGDFKADNVGDLSLSGDVSDILGRSGVNVINFEAPVTGHGGPIRKSGPVISQSVDSPGWLENRGFNAISLANNHAMDYGKQGLEFTIDSFRKSVVMGAGPGEEAYSFRRFKLDNYDVGIICATQCEFGTLYAEDISNDDYGCAWIFHDRIEKMIFENKDSVDAIFLYLHAGVEYLEVPIPEWRRAYRHFIDIGADAVIASHPHVPQGMELYKDKPIFYSLGNFCFQTGDEKRLHKHWNDSLVCTMAIVGKHEVSFSIASLHYDCLHNSVVLDPSIDLWTELNEMLGDATTYKKIVDKAALDMLPKYLGLFTRSGLVHNPFSKWFIKGGLDFFRQGGRDMTHAMNNIRCESHRWMIQRGISIKYGI